MANSIIFNALSGAELQKVLVDKLKFALEQSGEFPAHRTFPWVKIKLTLALTCHPQMDMKEEPVNVFPPLEVEAGELVGLEPQTIDMTLTQVLDTPDKARLESDLPLPIQTEIRAGQESMHVDKPTVPIAAPARVTTARPQSAPRVNIPAPSPMRVPVPVPGAKTQTPPPPPPPPAPKSVMPSVVENIDQLADLDLSAPPNPTGVVGAV